MADEEQFDQAPQGSLYASAAAVEPARRSLRRRQAIVAVTGAAAILAGGIFLGTQLIDARQSTLPEPAALAPQTPPSTSGPAVEEPPPRFGAKPTLSAARAKLSPSPSPSLSDEQLASAAAGGFFLQPRSDSPDTQVMERVETTRDGTIRVTSARRDLTGQGLLALVTDPGTAVGGARCTDRIRSGDGGTAEQPHALLCWRTSPARSVVTMAVNRDRRPAASASVAVLEREWAALG